MGRRPSEPLRALMPSELQELQRVVRASSERADRRQRATALLAVVAGQSYQQAAAQAGWQASASVRFLVRRFNRTGLAALGIAPGRGRQPTYDQPARTCIVACAQRQPDREQDGTARWSLSLLERTLRGEFATLGATTIRRVLQDAGSSYQQTRTWCPTGTAIRKRKAGPVQVVDPQTEEKRDA
jgi:transposase